MTATSLRLVPLIGLLSVARWAAAHHGAFSKGMYCLNGPQAKPNQNNNNPVVPMYQLEKEQWWMHHVDKCDEYPPPPGEFLEIPVGKQFTVEIATNQAFTTFSYNGTMTSDWTDGKTHPEDFHNDTCITSPNLHTQNQTMAAGTAFAISYTPYLNETNEENLVVFTVRYHTPWKRLTTYDVPADLPPCPDGGCICAWGWVPNGCGEPNMYMFPYRCMVTGSTSTKKLATAKPPVWCEGQEANCTAGAKQMIYWHQLTGNNIEVSGYDLHGQPKSPAYNMNCGFKEGAQNDIFEDSSPSTIATTTKSTSTASASKAQVDAVASTSPTSQPAVESSGHHGQPHRNFDVYNKHHRKNLHNRMD